MSERKSWPARLWTVAKYVAPVLLLAYFTDDSTSINAKIGVAIGFVGYLLHLSDRAAESRHAQLMERLDNIEHGRREL